MNRTSTLFAALALCGSAAAQIGIIDTIGGTIYDWQVCCVEPRYVANSRATGMYVRWMWSVDTVGTQADRNIRCNFYDYATRRWVFGDSTTPYMERGVNVFQQRSGFGDCDVDPVTGQGVFICHQGSAPIYPHVAREVEPGTGVFEFCIGSPQLDWYLYPQGAVGLSRTVHLVCNDDPTRDNLFYSRAATWCNWDPPLQVATNPPYHHSHSIAASKVSNRVCLAWTQTTAFPYNLYIRQSTDGGASWETEVDLGYPPAFGPDTGCSYYITSAFPFFDSLDRLHIVADVMPIISDTVWGWPNEIWHWCESNNPPWGRVHRADANPRGNWDPGTNALFACRPSIGEDHRGNLLVSWEQFDSLNVDPSTRLMRADIWLAGSSDNGLTWQPAVRITEPNTESKRFPCISDMAFDGRTDPDTVVVLYIADSVAGFRAGSSPVGAWSHNPMIAQKVPVDAILAGVAETGGRPAEVRIQKAEIRTHNPARNKANIRYSLPVAGDVSLAVLDAAGRAVAVLASGFRPAGTHTIHWDAKAAPGIYFVQMRTGPQNRAPAAAKIVLTN